MYTKKKKMQWQPAQQQHPLCFSLNQIQLQQKPAENPRKLNHPQKSGKQSMLESLLRFDQCQEE